MFPEKLFCHSFSYIATSGNRWYKHTTVAHLRPQKADMFFGCAFSQTQAVAGH
jgi:hypothetical protein